MPKLLTPSEVPEEVVCRTIKVPNSLEWLGIFNAVLLAGTYSYNWSDDVPGSLTPEEAAEAYKVVFYDYLLAAMNCDVCTQPGGARVIQQDEFGRWKMLEDGAYVPPSGDYAIPPLNARTEPTADERRCLAAANAANVLQQLYEALADEYATNHDLALFFLAIGTSIALLFLPPLGLAAAAFLEAATILVSEAFFAFAFLTADVWTEGFTEKLVCILYNRATSQPDDTVTFDFNAVRNDIVNELAFTIDFTLAEQRLSLQLGAILGFIGADGLDYAGSTTAIETYDCSPCAGTWCEWIDLTAAPGEFVPGDTGIIWVDGEGWKAQNYGGNNCWDLFGNYPLGEDVAVTSVTAIFNRPADIGGGNVVLTFRANLDGFQQAVYTNVPGLTGNPLCIELDEEITVDSFYVDSNSGAACSISYLRGFVLRGNGVPPGIGIACDEAPC